MTVAERPRPPAAAWFIVADNLDKVEANWWRRRPPHTGEASQEDFVVIHAAGVDRVNTEWVLWLNQFSRLVPFLRNDRRVRFTVVARKGA